MSSLLKKFSRKVTPTPNAPKLYVPMNSEPFIFYTMTEGFTFYTEKVLMGQYLSIGEQIPLNCMFEARWLLKDNTKIGYLFNTQFQSTNGGGYILTNTQSGAGKANAVEVLVKTDSIVVYSFPNKGALIVSPQVGAKVQNILETQ